MSGNNVKTKNCVWCDCYLRSNNGSFCEEVNKKLIKLHIDCKEELKKIRKYIGKEEFWRLLHLNNIDMFDVYSSYQDFINK